MRDVQVEEKELDANKVSTAMAGLIASQKADREAQRLRYTQHTATEVFDALALTSRFRTGTSN